MSTDATRLFYTFEQHMIYQRKGDFMEIYIVQPGDSVYSIAQQYGVSPSRIVYDNGLLSPDGIVPGQALLILIPEIVHTVGQGDSIFSISAEYDISPLELLRNNPYLTNNNYLAAGQQLVISYRVQKGRKARLSGFVYPSVRQNILRAVVPYATYLMIFGYGFREDGSIISVEDKEIIAIAHENRTAVLLSLSLIEETGGFNTNKLAALLTNIEFQNRVISGMIAEINAKGCQGMDIDMEYIPGGYRDEFTAFVENSAQQLHAAGLTLNIDLAPKYSDEQQGLLYEAHNYPLLGQAADLAFLMTYEWGYMYGPPMAIAPINNVSRVLDYALTEIAPEKLFLGIPNYAYDWTLPFVQGQSAAQVIGNITAADRAFIYGAEIQFDEASQSPFYYYTAADGTTHNVWFEDVRSISAKYQLIDSSGIAGGGYWNFMRAFPQGYLLFNNTFIIEKVYPYPD